MSWRKWVGVGGGVAVLWLGTVVLLAAPAVAQQSAPVTVTVRCPANGPQLSGFPRVFPLGPGGSVSIGGIPAGVECSVTETDQGGASSVTYVTNGGTPSANPPTVTVSPGAFQNVQIANSFPPPPPPPPPPPKVAAAVVVRDVVTQIPLAFVAGEPLRVNGVGPSGCDPYLLVDGQRQPGTPAATANGFNLDVATSQLSAGKHVASIRCTSPSAEVAQTVFWIAAGQTSSNVFFVVIASLLVVLAVGWVLLRTLVGSAVVAPSSKDQT